MSDVERLRSLAAWYRDLAARADEPRIWYGRMHTAEILDRQADEERTRDRAYFIWLKEGRPEGRAQEHWRQAKAELAVHKSAGVTDDGKLLGASPEDPGVLLPRRR